MALIIFRVVPFDAYCEYYIHFSDDVDDERELTENIRKELLYGLLMYTSGDFKQLLPIEVPTRARHRSGEFSKRQVRSRPARSSESRHGSAAAIGSETRNRREIRFPACSMGSGNCSDRAAKS